MFMYCRHTQARAVPVTHSMCTHIAGNAQSTMDFSSFIQSLAKMATPPANTLPDLDNGNST